MLLRLGADSKVENRDGASPLALAVVAGHDDVADLLLQDQAVGSPTDGTIGTTSYANLVRACRDSDAAASLERVSRFFIESPESQDAWSDMLCAACLRGNDSMAALAIRNGGKIRTRTDDGKNPLHEAIARDNDDLVKQLLEANCGVEVKARDSRGRNALHLVVSNRYGNDNSGLMVWQGKTNRGNMVRMLVVAGALPNDRTSLEGDTALHIAVGTGDPQAVNALLACGASVNIRNARGRTPVHAAVRRYPFSSIVAMLLRDHGCATAKDLGGYTPLHLILLQRDEAASAMDHLILAGADASMPAANGDRPIHCAARRGNWNIAKRLVEQGAGVNQVGAKGRMALHVAARYGHADLVENLLAMGAKLDALDGRRWAAIHHAVERRHANVVEVLLRVGERMGLDA